MLISRLALGGLLLASSLASHAQATDLVPTPRFYGGLGVYTSSHHNLSSWANGARIPVQAVIGYQLRPRLAVQLGLAYSGNRNSYFVDSYSYNYPPPPNTSSSVTGTSTERSTTTSLLARYTLTRKLAHRFQADLLGGAKFEYSRYRDVGVETSYDQTTAISTATPYEYPSTYNCTLLSLGVSLRYRVVSSLEAVYDFTFDLPVAGGNYSNSNYSPARRTQATMALGLRYRFGPS
jgi:hypothetical protein